VMTTVGRGDLRGWVLLGARFIASLRRAKDA